MELDVAKVGILAGRTLDEIERLSLSISLGPTARAPHHGLALGSIARAHGLLASMTVLEVQGRRDALGVLNRAIFEVWLLGLVVHLGDESDLEKIDSDDAHFRNKLAKQLPGLVEPVAAVGHPWPVFQRAERLGELFAARGLDATVPTTWYRSLYAIESLNGAHAGLDSLRRHLDVGAEKVAIIFSPDEGSAGLAHLASGAHLAGMLAQMIYNDLGLDTTTLSELAASMLELEQPGRDDAKELCRRLVGAAIGLGAHVTTMSLTDGLGQVVPPVPITAATGCLGEWHPDTGALWTLDVDSDSGRAMVLAHELGHVVLHPKGEPSLGPTLAEEATVHHAASIVCDRFAVPGYLADLARADGCPRPGEAAPADAAALAARIIQLVNGEAQ